MLCGYQQKRNTGSGYPGILGADMEEELYEGKLVIRIDESGETVPSQFIEIAKLTRKYIYVHANHGKGEIVLEKFDRETFKSTKGEETYLELP